MSDFASLLKNFSTTAATTTAAPKREAAPPPPEEPRPKKRNRPNDHTEIEKDFIEFLCIGAQKAGTSWLHSLLTKIPFLSLAKQKEVHFFDWHRHQGLVWYARQFGSTSSSSCIRGEVTPDYIALSEDQVEEIAQLFPNLRIIFIARDLVDRAWSAMTMELRNNVYGLSAGDFGDYSSSQELSQQIKDKLEREADPANQKEDYFLQKLKNKTHTERSDYATGLKRWLKYFSADQILLLDYKDVADRPKEFLNKVLEHMRVSDVANVIHKHVALDDLAKRVNASIRGSNSIRSPLRQKMQNYLRPFAVEFNTLKKEHWPTTSEWELQTWEQKT